MIPSTDPFWNITEREREEERQVKAAIDSVERAINLGKRARQICNQPGYQDFLKAVQDIKAGVVHQLTFGKADNDLLRELRGRASGINDVLAILTQTDHALDLLESQLVKHQAALAEVATRRPKPKEAKT